MILVLLGAPGSGKGTQAKIIQKERGYPQLSTGDMLRTAVSVGTRLGLEAKKFMDKGELVPDEVVVGMILERTAQEDCKKGYVLDGFPRTIPQAEALDGALNDQSCPVDKVLFFQVNDDQVVGRLCGRRVCEKCGHLYHVDSNPTKADGVCDHCGGKTIQRDDDQDEVIRKRLKVYADQTAPLKGYYEKQGKIVTIDASQEPAQVTAEILELVK